MALISGPQDTGRIPSSEGSWATLGPATIYRSESIIELEATSPGIVHSSISIEITEHRSIGWDRRSQVVVARLVRGYLRGSDAAQSTLSAGSHIVAKFYDPRFANAPHEWAGGSPEMCHWSKENETRAYRMLTEVQGSCVPIYYGEYSCLPPLECNPNTRISVLLFEFVQDPDLVRQIHLQHSADELLALKAAAFSVLKKIHAYGVYQYDTTAANVLWGRERNVVTLVDFDRACFADSGSFSNMPRADEYLEAHDRGMMYSALEALGIEDDRRVAWGTG